MRGWMVAGLWLMAILTGPTLGVGVAENSPVKTLSLDLNQADLHDVLRHIAAISGLNVIASPEVQGRVTARLQDVPWPQALEVILKLHGLTQERHGNVVLIMRRADVRARRQAGRQVRQLERQAGPPVTRVIPVKYADATVLKTLLEKLLGPCASVAVDPRHNALILRGPAACLGLP